MVWVVFVSSGWNFKGPVVRSSYIDLEVQFGSVVFLSFVLVNTGTPAHSLNETWGFEWLHLRATLLVFQRHPAGAIPIFTTNRNPAGASVCAACQIGSYYDATGVVLANFARASVDISA